MSFFLIKRIIASLTNAFGISSIMLRRLNKRNTNYVRVINYHETDNCDADNFVRQIKWFKKNYQIISYEEFKSFINGKFVCRDKPGLLITFDDGKQNNYSIGSKILNKNNAKGLFFISSDLIGTKGYMTWDNVKELIKQGHFIGCHTSTHHRMNPNDPYDVLCYEIKESKEKIENNLKIDISSFCWCGGEEKHYTKQASDVIKEAGYDYSFLTNSAIVTPETNHLLIERTNIEASWGISLIKFQICGFIDLKYKKKRQRVESLLS